MSEEDCDCPVAKLLKLLMRGQVIDARNKDDLARLLREILNSDEKDILRQMPKRKRI